MNETLLERYQRDPELREQLEEAARRERALTISRFLAESAEALFGTRRSPDSGKKELPSGPEAACCS